MIRCGWFLTNLAGGGAERIPLILASDFAETELSVILLKTLIDHQLDADAPRIYTLSQADLSLASNFAPIVYRAARLARSFDLLVAGLEWAPTFFAVAAGTLSRKPIVATVHTPLFLFHERDHVRRAWWTGMKRALSACDAIIAVSEDVKEGLLRLGVDKRKISVVANPAPRWNADRVVHGGPPRILTVAGLKWVKGIDVALAAAAQLRDVPFLWEFVGDGPEAVYLRGLASELGLNRHVRFAGFQADIRPHYAEADLYVLPSRVEGAPLVLAEAMTMGLPVVATRCGIGVDAALKGGAGVLVPVDDPQALGEAIRSLLADPEHAQRVGESARTRARQFEPRCVAKQYEEVFNSVLERRRARSG
jgi:glycosyltransferase involved in cell wall biosynthesis